MTPRPYQVEAYDAVRDHFQRSDRSLGAMLCMATGTGKTFTAGRMAVATLERKGQDGKPLGLRVLWVSHRRELVEQPVSTLCRLAPGIGRRCGIVQGRKHDAHQQFVSASVRTLAVDGRLEDYLSHGVPRLVVWDEAHHSVSSTQLDIRERIEAAAAEAGTLVFHMGLTATPEGLGLAELWRIVFDFDIRAAQRAGYLLPERIVVERLPDLEEADYRTDEEEGDALLLAGVVDHTVSAMEEHARGRHALVFTANVKQAEATAQALRDAGWRAAAVDGTTAKGRRRQVLRAFQAGQLDVIVNASVFTEGTDLPRCDCVVWARSCRSKILWIQGGGRGLRLFGPGADGFRPGVDEEQRDCLILDLSGASLEHGDFIMPPVLLDSDIERRDRGTGAAEADDGVEGDERTPHGGMRAKREPIKAAWVEVDNLDRRVFSVDLGRKGRGRARGKDTEDRSYGHVLVVQDPHTGLWSSYYAPTSSKARLKRMSDRVGLAEAQAMGNDLVRQASALTTPFAPWRKRPAGEKSRALARQLKIDLPKDCTEGRCSMLIGAKLARSLVLSLGLAQSLDIEDLADDGLRGAA